jgi:hypothetical protein
MTEIDKNAEIDSDLALTDEDTDDVAGGRGPTFQTVTKGTNKVMGPNAVKGPNLVKGP